jgi:hypothetical protein
MVAAALTVLVSAQKTLKLWAMASGVVHEKSP